MVDPVAFRSERLPTGHFDARFSEDNLRFWVPLLTEAGRITPGLDGLDVGCGTRGFTREISRLSGPRVTGCDRSERFLELAEGQPSPESVSWIAGEWIDPRPTYLIVAAKGEARGS